MLGQIANYCPVISRNIIIKNSISIESIWQSIRAHYGFQSNGSHFIDFVNIKLEVDERHEDLYQRMIAFIDDNLITPSSGITHNGEILTEEEEMSPTLENLVTLLWLKSIHKDLPALVKQRYGTELRSRTLASIKPEISQAMESLLETVKCNDESKIMRASSNSYHNRSSYNNPSRNKIDHKYRTSNKKGYSQQQQASKRSCPLCKSSNRPHDHHLSQCSYLPEADKKFLTRARMVHSIYERDDSDNSSDEEQDPDINILAIRSAKEYDMIGDNENPLSTSTHRVQINRSPFIIMHHNHHPIKLTLDSGAETSMIKESVARSINAPIKKSTQIAFQADGSSPLSIKGETKLTLNRDGKTFEFEALVVEDIDVDILAGVPFMIKNDITVRPAKFQISFNDGTSCFYNHDENRSKDRPLVCLSQSHILRAPPKTTTIWPGEYIELELPDSFPEDTLVALEPRNNKSYDNENEVWPVPNIVTPVARKIRIPNLTSSPKILKRNEHFSQIHTVIQNVEDKVYVENTVTVRKSSSKISSSYTDITVDPESYLHPSVKQAFLDLHKEFKDTVFDKSIGCYNGSFGPVKGVVNMGPIQPPQRKGRVPQYSRDKLSLLQDQCDALESEGVLERPENLNIVAEYLNPSFLINKQSGGHRLVTAFGEVAKYAKPQPALMSDINSTIRAIGHWNHIITTDLTKAFYQIPLSEESYKYCGIATPFKGVRVYTRCAMGMPGSETALEQLMSIILGDLLQEGRVAKVADDLYIGGDTPEQLLATWKRVLEALHKANLSLSPSKTIIAPTKTTILGWSWSNGTLTASPHRIATLSTCSIPTTVNGLRSFLGAYKFLSRVIPNCSTVLSPLEDIVAGKASKEKILWTSNQTDAFSKAQNFITNNKSITLPRPSDQIWIVTDGSVKNYGLGSTMYVTRNNSLKLAGYYSAKLQKRQSTWIPCEIEALSIAASLQHFSPYLIQSSKKGVLLTDSKPCVQAYSKLCRGQYSNSAIVSTFLSVACRYQIEITHLSGKANVPSDFASRNAPKCTDHNCQICSFVNQMEEATVHSISTHDIMKGIAKMPFITRSTWLTTQSECADLRRAHAHLSQGTTPSKKATNIKDVKRYLNVASISKDGLLIVKKTDPLSACRERIIVPRSSVLGLLTALHIRLSHPTIHQLTQVFNRYFFALNLDDAIAECTNGCHTCASLKSSPNFTQKQTTSSPPESIGTTFAADVLKQNRQLILLLRECVTSYTSTCIVPDEGHIALRDGLISLAIHTASTFRWSTCRDSC